MAKIYPGYSLEEVYQKVTNSGEREVYQALMSLPDTYEVIYRKYYVPLNSETNERECDFIILHKDYGMMTVEVKGGHIEYKNRTWYAVKNGVMEMDSDPIEQARSAMYHFRDIYSQKTGKPLHMNMIYSICFPNGSKDMNIEFPLERNRIFFKEDLHEIEIAIVSAFKSSNKYLENSNYSQEIKDLKKKVFAVTEFTIKEQIGDWLKNYNQNATIVFTEEQQSILNAELENRILTLGPAGSGKTLIAIEKACRLVEEGNKILFTCFNYPLGEFIRETIQKRIDYSENMTIGNYHSIAKLILDSSGYQLPERVETPDGVTYYLDGRQLTPDEQNVFFSERIPQYIDEYGASLSEEDKYDALIIDEGQDFDEMWLLTLATLIKKDSKIHVFADKMQNIYQTQSDMIKTYKSVFDHLFVNQLTKNLRNTQQIHNVLQQINQNDYQTESRLKGGKPIEYIPFQDQNDEIIVIKKIINKLISEKVSPQQMIILSPYKKENSCLAHVQAINNQTIIESHRKQDRCIRFQTIKRFKGLESDVVILIDIGRDRWNSNRKDLYVAFSRAKYLLYVVHDKKWSVDKIIN